MIKQFTFNHFEVNTYLIIDEGTKQCAIVDPACEASFEDAQLTQYIEAEQLQVTHILLTHAHVDHIAGLRQVCAAYGLPVTMHAEGHHLLRQASVYGSVMGFNVPPLDDLEQRHIADGDVLAIGQTFVECRYTPGHCPGSMSFYVKDRNAVLTGDALFHFSIGRTDLPGGDYDLLIDSLKQKILSLDDAVAVLPGHGISSTVGKERRYNPYLQ
ncbi:MAG: MBL fold metallo-hydrolase [Bacteroidales bacterium]|nr:MBL fold metallo-hydrolase [Bacteroidales bacterium]